jgi:hypothetical protein
MLQYLSQQLRQPWDLARWVRLLLGLGFFASGVYDGANAAMLLGGLLMLTAGLNAGCTTCASGTCAPHAAKMTRPKADARQTPVTVEEVRPPAR